MGLCCETTGLLTKKRLAAAGSSGIKANALCLMKGSLNVTLDSPLSPTTRRNFLGGIAQATAGIGFCSLFPCSLLGEAPQKRIAAIVTEYRQNSHADVIVTRFLQGYQLGC